MKYSIDQKGYTLVELVVVMLIFIILTIMASSAFENIYKASRQQQRLAESNIEGIVGLELMRSDISHAGFGLPWVFDNMSTLNYAEADMGADSFAKGINPNDYNDTPRAPRAVVVGSASKYVNGTSGAGPDYLVIKSSKAATNDTAKRWTYFVYSTAGGLNKSYLKPRVGNENYELNDRIISVANNFNTQGVLTRNLLVSGGSYSIKIDGSDPADAFKPVDGSQQVVTYGLYNSATVNPRMPFNRTDYYIQRPSTAGSMPERCNSGTGNLYKSVINHRNGGFSPIVPLLDCVGDMKVIYNMDMDDDGSPGTFVNPSVSAGSARTGTETTSNETVASTLADASLLRKRLKEVRVYILAHEGGKDKNFTYPVSDTSKAIIVGDPAIESVSKVWDVTNLSAAFGADWKNFRWKIYRIVVRPSSLY